jgi:hypothetical protein
MEENKANADRPPASRGFLWEVAFFFFKGLEFILIPLIAPVALAIIGLTELVQRWRHGDAKNITARPPAKRTRKRRRTR